MAIGRNPGNKESKLRERFFSLAVFGGIIAITRWAYFFLPSEYLEDAHLLTMEFVLAMAITILATYMRRLHVKIRKIESKTLDTQDGQCGSAVGH